MKELIRYEQTPQVTCLEYSEMKDLREHPEKKDFYLKLAKSREIGDRNAK